MFDNYVPDCPGTAGDIMLVIWPGGVNLFEMFLIKDEELEPVAQEEGLRVKSSPQSIIKF